MKCKVFLSDEGYGHIVRQQAVINELQKLSNNNISFTIQTKNHFDVAKRLIKVDEYISRFNNITWSKSKTGSPNLPLIEKFYFDYIKNSDNYISEELIDFKHDFLISDFVYEPFYIGKKLSKPTFGICHFTWDWFFSKLYPPPLDKKTITHLIKYAKMATKLYFPPFTPDEIVKNYKNFKKVPLIVREKKRNIKVNDPNRFKILIIDSGSGILKKSIIKALKNSSSNKNFRFYVSSKNSIESDNVVTLQENEFLMDYIDQMDLIVGRAGFNTISESLAYRTPMLLIGESMNPEINENILNLHKVGLCSFIPNNEFENNFNNFLTSFVDKEYYNLLQKVKKHNIPTNGAEVIAKDILRCI